MNNSELFEELGYRIDEIRKEEYSRGYRDANRDKEVDLLGRENVNFSIADDIKDQKRKDKYKKQRMTLGFDDTELWNLDTTILKFILPRLKRFRELTVGYPPDFSTLKEWQECLEKMILNIEKIIEDKEDANYEGFELFKKYFFYLWW